MDIRRNLSFALGLVCLAAASRAAIPPVEQVLPADTMVLFSIPDWAKALKYLSDSPQGRLWADPSMKAFRESFGKRFGQDVLGPIEKELGVTFSEYKALAQGQLACALTRNGWDGKSDNKLGWIFLLDSKDKSEQLKTQLAALKKKWLDGGRMVRMDKIRDTEFVTLVGQESDLDRALQKAFPKSPLDEARDEPGFGPPAKNKKPGQYEISFGQVDTLLIVGNVTRDIEKFLARLAGVSLPALAALEMHPLDTADRVPELRKEHGIGYCNITKCCTKVCPEHITITDNAIIPLKERVVDEFFDPIGRLVKIYSRRKKK